MLGFLHHLFVPHPNNNHRSKLLHNSSIFIIVLILIFSCFLLGFIKKTDSQILGVSYSLSENELLILVNKQREEKGLQPLAINENLSKAAEEKANDMFKRNYWAHFAPDGTSPWQFIKSNGYTYLYAGENLAKGFTSSEEVVEAWMQSPTHRDNILSGKYNDIGFAIMKGKLLGEETVLVVEMFGSTSYMKASSLNNSNNYSLLQQPVEKVIDVSENNQSLILGRNIIYTKPLVDIFFATKSLIFTFLSIVLLALVIDLVIVERRKIPRLVGHNLDHIILILLFILFIVFRSSGVVY